MKSWVSELLSIPVWVEVWPVRKVEREGAQSAVLTIAFENRAQSGREFVYGMSLTVVLYWSSVITTTMFGRGSRAASTMLRLPVMIAARTIVTARPVAANIARASLLMILGRRGAKAHEPTEQMACSRPDAFPR